MHKFAFKIPPLTFCILPGLGIAVVDIWEDQKLKLFIRSQTPSSVFITQEKWNHSISTQNPFCFPLNQNVSWLRHLINIGTLWTKADKRDKIFSIPRLSDKCLCVRCDELLSVFTCLSLYPHSWPFSWYRSYLLTWHPLLSPLSPDSIILVPEARLVARAAYCTLCTVPPLLSEYR